MTAFWLAAGGLSALAWLLLFGFVPAKSVQSVRVSTAGGANLRVLKEQLRALDAEFSAGAIDSEEHRATRREIERRVLAEASDQEAASGDQAVAPSRRTAAWLALCIPAAAFACYGLVGNLGGVLQLPPPAAETRAPNAGSTVSGTVRLAPELAKLVLPTDTVFVFAREAGTGGMPLAAARFSAADLPLAYTLDERSGMGGAKKLADVATLVVSARISRSGKVAPGAGDLRGESAAVSGARDAVEVTIDAVER